MSGVVKPADNRRQIFQLKSRANVRRVLRKRYICWPRSFQAKPCESASSVHAPLASEERAQPEPPTPSLAEWAMPATLSHDVTTPSEEGWIEPSSKSAHT